MDVVDPVRAGRHPGRVEEDVRRQVRVGAGVGDHLDLRRGDPAVALDAGPVGDRERVPLRGREERLLPRVDELHRAAGLPREEREEDLDGDVLLAPERAADHRPADAHLVLRYAEGAGDRAEVLDHLRGDADVDHALFVDPRDAGVRLEVGVLDERHPERVLDDQVGFGHAGLEVALADRVPADDVVRLEQDRRPGRHRLFRIEDRGQVLVLDLDPAERLLGEGDRLRGDERDRLADVADRLERQDRRVRAGAHCAAGLAGQVGVQLRAFDVLAGEHARDAGQRPCLRDVESDDPRVRPAAPKHLDVEHVRHREIGRVHRRPDRLSKCVDPPQGLTNLAELREFM